MPCALDRAQLRHLLAGALDAGLEALADGLAQALPPPGPVRMVAIASLVVRPAVYQFRISAISASGTDQRLRDCSQFRRELAGVVLVWREPGGDLALLDGHHRLQLARRSGVADLAVLEVEAPDAKRARVIGALANVAAGNATPADLARLLRDEAMTAAQLEAYGISRRSRLLQDAAGLQALDPSLFGRHCTGEIDLPTALALAAAGAPAHQQALAREAERRRWAPDQIAEAATLARLATVTTTTPAGCIPGLTDLMAGEGSDVGALLAVRAAIRRQLAGELRALATVARQPAALALEDRAVAVVDLAAAADARDSGRASLRFFDLIAGQVGPLQDCIRRLADLVTPSRPAAEVVRRHLADVRAAIAAELSG